MKKDLIMSGIVIVIMIGLFWIISLSHTISLIWILSPIWEIALALIIAVILALIKVIVLAIIDFIKSKRSE